jgi:hypothetical protein
LKKSDAGVIALAGIGCRRTITSRRGSSAAEFVPAALS